MKNSAATLDRAVKLAEGLPGMNFEAYFRKTLGMYKFDESQLARQSCKFENFAFDKTLG